MNRLKFAFIGIIAALMLTGCADRQGLSGNSGTSGSENSEPFSTIGAKEAEKAALDHAGFTPDKVTFTKTEYDRDSTEYEIEFTADGYLYEYDISAADGSVIEFSKKIINTPNTSGTSTPTTQPTPTAPTDTPETGEEASAPPLTSDTPAAPTEVSRITLEEAKEAALGHAGVTADEVTFTKTKLDYDDGREEYDIEFVSDDYEYEYEIDAASGAVLSHSKEARSRQAMANAADRITLDEAKAAALDHAGVTASDVTFIKTKLDRDDEGEEYEIEFVSEDYKYEYEIDAGSGAVLYDSKKARKGQTMSAAEDQITLEEAKNAALAHAGVDASDATFTKTKLDYDDGTVEYDIKFYVGGSKYEYTVDAATGEIIEYDIED